MTNAAKYTPRGGTFILSAALEAEALTITVSDTGAGFDPSVDPDRVHSLLEAYLESRRA